MKIPENVKKFIIKYKDLINKGEWGDLIYSAINSDYYLSLEDLNTIVKMLQDTGIKLSSEKLLSKFSHSLTDTNTMHEDFYKEFNLKNMHQFQGETINKFDFTAKNNYRFDFEDVPVEKNAVIGGNKLSIITAGTYIEFKIDLYNDLDHEALLGTYYFYDNELAKNIIVLDDFGIGYNKNKIEDCIFNLLRGLK